MTRRGVDSNKIFVVTNGVDLSQFSPRKKDQDLVARYNLQGKFVAGYIGTHGLAHSLDTLLDAASRLSKLPDGDLFRILLLGDGANKSSLKKRAKAESLDNIIFVDTVSKDEVVRYWSILDVSIIHLKKNELFTTVIPSKLFECMGMAIPILHGVLGESAAIVEQEQVGLVFEPQNSELLCESLLKLGDDLSMYNYFKLNGPEAAKQYDRKVLARKMLVIIDNLHSN